jgi:hypothetical protein
VLARPQGPAGQQGARRSGPLKSLSGPYLQTQAITWAGGTSNGLPNVHTPMSPRLCLQCPQRCPGSPVCALSPVPAGRACPQLLCVRHCRGAPTSTRQRCPSRLWLRPRLPSLSPCGEQLACTNTRPMQKASQPCFCSASLHPGSLGAVRTCGALWRTWDALWGCPPSAQWCPWWWEESRWAQSTRQGDARASERRYRYRVE